MELPKGIRLNRTGTGFEVTIVHEMLPKGRVFRTFADPVEGEAYRERMLGFLKQGIVPAELTRLGVRKSKRTLPARRRKAADGPAADSVPNTISPDLKTLLEAYLAADSAKISKTDRPLVEQLCGELKGNIDGVTTYWVDAWVRHMKRNLKHTPGTIRKKVECLARAIDWHFRQRYPSGGAPANVLRQLPRGYSSYGVGDAPKDAVPHDKKRDRRLLPGEYEEIEAVLQGKKRADRQRPWAGDDAPDFLMLFRLIVHTGLRLREAYRLRVRDVDFAQRTIFVRKSKTGAQRQVPTSRQLEQWLRDYIGDKAADDLVFPFWSGADDEAALTAVSNMLSRRFSSLFRHCGCTDLVEHDLRHEATCRWMEMRDARGQWLFRPEEVRRITGHETEAVFMRYLSMRGSDLAARLD